MLDTSARLLSLLALLQSRRFWTGAELAERLSVTGRTVRRDVERLRSLGYPVDASVGMAGGYQMGSSATLPPLLLDNNEALAVTVGLRIAASGSISGVEEAAVRALTKIEQLLSAKLKKRIRGMQETVSSFYIGGPVVDAEVLATLALATHNQETALFRYQDRAKNPTRRHVQPHGLVHVGRRWYLLAWDLSRESWRTFRIDRVEGEVRIGSSFVRRVVPGGSIARFVTRSISTEIYPAQARVLFFAPKKRLTDCISPLAGELEDAGDGRCVLTSGARSLSFLALHVANLGEEFEVLEPPELIEELSRLSARLRRAKNRSRKRQEKRL